jgi:aminopeptidase N
MKTFLCLLFAAGLALAGESPQGPPEHVGRDRTYDVLHYRLAVAVDPKLKTCAGEMTVTLVSLRGVFDELRLDAADMRVKWVSVDQKQLAFHAVEETLVVELGKPYGFGDTISATIAYAVTTPTKGLYFVAPDSGYPDKQLQAWTQGEPDDNHHWFPCYDYPNDKATSEMLVTVPENFTAISNGKLLEVRRDPAKHTATFHWYEGRPHVSYLTSLVVGEYVEVKQTWDGVPLSYYVYKHQKEHALLSFGKTPKMMEFYSKKTGLRYPWEKYAQTVVQDFIWGGEENVTATTLADGTIHDGRAHLDYSSDNLVAHELAHQWWGDLLTCRDWSHAWLNEGFATFFQNQFTEYDRGHDEAAKETMDNQATLRNTDVGDRRRPSVCRRFYGPNDLFDNRIYGKGSVVLNMLKDLLGEELFWTAIDHYVERFAFGSVETNDFKIAVEEATGYNLEWFFNQWLYKAGFPEFELSSAWSRASSTLNLTVRQTQRLDSLTSLFTMPVDVELWIHGVPETHRVWISKAEEVFSFPAYQEPELVLFDKGSKQMKKVAFQKPLDAWLFQLGHASEGVDRLLAIDELTWVVDSANVADALRKAAIDDPFWDVRRSAVWALGDTKAADVEATLLAAYGDHDARVRTAAVTSMGKLHTAAVLATLHHAFEKDSSYGVAAAALRSLVRADSVNLKTYCAAALQRSSRNEMIRSAAIQSLAHVGDDEALGTVLSYTRYGVDRNIRIECVNTLASTWKTRDEVVSHLIRMLADPSFHVRRSVINALGNIRNARALEPLQQRMVIETDTRVVKDVRDAVEKIQLAQQSH